MQFKIQLRKKKDRKWSATYWKHMNWPFKLIRSRRCYNLWRQSTPKPTNGSEKARKLKCRRSIALNITELRVVEFHARISPQTQKRFTFVPTPITPPPCQCKQNRDVISTQRFIKVHSDVLNIFLRVDSSLMIIKAYFDAEKNKRLLPINIWCSN